MKNHSKCGIALIQMITFQNLGKSSMTETHHQHFPCCPQLQVAFNLEVTIVGSSILERSANHLYNTCFVFGPDGLESQRPNLGK